jgi:hypothetical protein
MECFLNALEGERDRDEGGAMFDSLSDLTVEACADFLLVDEWELELRDFFEISNDRIGRLCRGLERRRALGATTLRSLTFVQCPGLHAEKLRALLRTYDESLQVTVIN